MKYIFFFVFVASSITIYSQDERWVLYHSEYYANYYYDKETMVKKNNVIYLWEKQLSLTETKDMKGRKISYSLLKIEIYCDEGKYRVMSSTDYFENGSTYTDDEVSQYYYALPESLREKLINAVCQRN